MASKLHHRTPRLITWRCTVIDQEHHRFQVRITARNLADAYRTLDTSFPDRRAEFVIRSTPV